MQRETFTKCIMMPSNFVSEPPRSVIRFQRGAPRAESRTRDGRYTLEKEAA